MGRPPFIATAPFTSTSTLGPPKIQLLARRRACVASLTSAAEATPTSVGEAAGVAGAAVAVAAVVAVGAGVGTRVAVGARVGTAQPANDTVAIKMNDSNRLTRISSPVDEHSKHMQCNFQLLYSLRPCLARAQAMPKMVFPPAPRDGSRGLDLLLLQRVTDWLQRVRIAQRVVVVKRMYAHMADERAIAAIGADAGIHQHGEAVRAEHSLLHASDGDRAGAFIARHGRHGVHDIVLDIFQNAAGDRVLVGAVAVLGVALLNQLQVLVVPAQAIHRPVRGLKHFVGGCARLAE